MGVPSLQLRPAGDGLVSCKVCGADAPLFGVQDFNRSCEELRGKFLPLSGVPVYYRRCVDCGLLFTDAFDDWPDDAFARHIYNDDYLAVDPDFETARPTNNAAVVARSFDAAKGSLDVLDYGGGNGAFAQSVRDAGFRAAATYDRFHPAHQGRPDGKFNLVTCFETLEHMPDPVNGVADMISFLADDGLMLVSTLVQPPDILKVRMHWWYAGPRNGHVTLFSYQALARLFARFELRIYPTNSPAFHFACRRVPAFAAGVIGTVDAVSA